ncbi:methyltransferase domain-containing protein [Lactiplantibacillus garii]|uniref:Methyltransferase domain-containing protein n=1 Tax=Lactiplantibacillus garii TaxID=2306423 RepID=A0A3R8L1E0_9LACO|nr:methyltransferase [Lactiplantibacillus garii]RRK10620.1 methyltransferase domain-containing protein [Lactiplantibacillus garii]
MLTINYQATTLQFETDPEVFSPHGLDLGTESMMEQLHTQDGLRVLDLGCGFGFVGIYLATQYPHDRVTMVDVDQNAVGLSKMNAQRNGVTPTILQSNGFEKLAGQSFDLVLSNPPYHTDFAVAKNFIEDAHRHLTMGGHLYMVTKRRKWYENKIRSTFGHVQVTVLNDYCVFYAEKRPFKKQKKNAAKEHTLSKKLQRKYDRQSHQRHHAK